MPGIAMLPGPTSTPQARNIQSFDKMFQTFREYEGMRRQKILNTNILQVLSQGGTQEEVMQGIAEAVRAANQPEFSSGISGVLERLSAPFAPQVGQQMTNVLAAQALKPQPKTEIQKLTDEGYTPEESKMIRDISHGLQPRASSRQTYDNMTEIEKMDFLTKVKQRAEGQYYGIEGGNVQPRDPKLLDWTLRELNKLPQYRQQGVIEGGPAKTGTLETKRTGFLGRKESEFPRSPSIDASIEKKARNEIGNMLLKMSGHDRAMMEAKIQRGIDAGLTYQQILTSKDFSPYREN